MWRCNAHTQGIYKGSLRNHILPALGTMPLDKVGRAEVAALHYGLRETPRAANRALMVLSKMFSLAEAWGVGPRDGNPCRFVQRYKEGRRERFLAEDEYRRVGRALCELEAEGPVSALDKVGRAEVAALHYGLRETPRAANRALMVLSKMFSLAEAWGVGRATRIRRRRRLPLPLRAALQGGPPRALPRGGRVPQGGPGSMRA